MTTSTETMETEQIRLSQSDQNHLDASQGWLELGDHIEANAELEKITPQMRIHPDVLEMRWHIYSKARQWSACVDIASVLVELIPDRSDAWLRHATALHKCKRTLEAYDALLPVAEKFPKVWRIPYNLACFCAQLGRIREAEVWFGKAIALDRRTVQVIGIDDPDLIPLWEAVGASSKPTD